jgi:type II secretory pathway pseudopilin PulG
MLIRRARMAGDTLIEVLFATSVFSLVAVGGLAVMNQGSDVSERALEITLVREQMDAQAQTLRFLNSSCVTAFQAGDSHTPSIPPTPADQWWAMSSYIKAHTISNPSAVGETTCPRPLPPLGSFIVNPQLGTFVDPSGGVLAPAKTFSQLTYDGSNNVTSAAGIWIEAVSSPTSGHIGYIDFHILTCWDSPGQAVPVTLGTIVRLYEPR